MSSQLSEAEERERVFSGRGRWNQVRSLADAKNLMNHLFNLASSSRCLLWDKEVDCREKDSHIRDLKERVVKLSTVIRQLEVQKSELVHQLKSQDILLKKHYKSNTADSGDSGPNVGPRKYGLRKQEHRASMFLFEDMDTSESENSHGDAAEDDDDEWVVDDDDDDWAESGKRPPRRRAKIGRRSPSDTQEPEKEVNGVKRENSGERTYLKDHTEICCSCSKSSSCKTSRCECRGAGSLCRPSCGCLSIKCTNRESASAKESEKSSEQDKSGASNDGNNEEAGESNLAAHGASLYFRVHLVKSLMIQLMMLV